MPGSMWLAAMPPFDLAAYVERSTAASEVPVHLADPVTLREIARLFSGAHPNDVGRPTKPSST